MINEQHVWTLRCDTRGCKSQVVLKTKKRTTQAAELMRRAKAKGWRSVVYLGTACPKCVKARQ